jgi:hypothetical protein
MNEPIYEYIKGQGWVVQSSPVITLKCGTRVRVERRAPLKNEVYWQVGHGSVIGNNYGFLENDIARAIVSYKHTYDGFTPAKHYNERKDYETYTLVVV